MTDRTELHRPVRVAVEVECRRPQADAHRVRHHQQHASGYSWLGWQADLVGTVENTIVILANILNRLTVSRCPIIFFSIIRFNTYFYTSGIIFHRIINKYIPAVVSGQAGIIFIDTKINSNVISLRKFCRMTYFFNLGTGYSMYDTRYFTNI